VIEAMTEGAAWIGSAEEVAAEATAGPMRGMIAVAVVNQLIDD
jgi:hypothetical protein